MIAALISGILTVMAAAGCGADDGPAAAAAPPTLAGTTWQLKSIQSMDDEQGTTTVPDPAKYTVSFGVDGQAVFQIDCNRGTSSWQSTPGETGDSGNLTFGPIATTLMACPPPTMDQRVSSSLNDVRTYLIQDGLLYLSLFADSAIMAWEPAG